MLLLLLGLIFFPSTGRDDSLILYWPAHTLVHSGQFLNNMFLQQVSSLSFPVLVAVFHFSLPIDLLYVGWGLSVVLGLLTVYLAAAYAQELGFSNSHFIGFLLATAIPMAYWTFSGMETTLYAFSLLLFVVVIAKFLQSERSVPGILTLLVTANLLLVRTEAPVILLFFFVAYPICLAVPDWLNLSWLSFRRPTRFSRKRRNLIVTFSLLFSLKLGFQKYYFDSIFPQPTIAKVLSGGSLKLVDGVTYVFQLRQSLAMTLLVMLLFAVLGLSVWNILEEHRDGEVPVSVSVLFVMLLAYLSFVVGSGGDWMEGGRFLAPGLSLIYLMIAAGFKNYSHEGFKRTVFAGLLIAQVVLLGGFIFHNSTSLPLFKAWSIAERRDLKDYTVVEIANKTTLKDIYVLEKLKLLGADLLQKQQRFSLISGQGGLIPYHLAREFFPNFIFVDRRGLVSSHFTDCQHIVDFGANQLGLIFPEVIYHKNREVVNQECLGFAPDLFHGSLKESQVSRELYQTLGLKLIYRNTLDLKQLSPHWLPGYSPVTTNVLLVEE
ncbi:MAG: hypothetical protein ABEK50_15545 [bacterium]